MSGADAATILEGNRQPESRLQGRNGICQNCCYGCSCIFSALSTRPIRFCEEFAAKGYSKAQITYIARRWAGRGEAGEKRASTQPVQIKGLCVNCDNRQECAFYSPNRCIWHCENYS